MKARKIISSFIMSIMTFSFLTTMNTSALLIQDIKDSERYNTIIEDNDEYLVSASELIEPLKDIFPDLNIKNVWIKAEPSSSLSFYRLEVSKNDFLTLSFKTLPEDYEAVINELKKEIGYEDLFDISAIATSPDVYNNLKITFTEENSELNYMIAEKAYSIANEKYAVESTFSQFENRQFLDTIVKSGFGLIDNISIYDSKEKYEMLLDEIYNITDHNMIKEKYSATFNKNGSLEFPEDITDIKKMECFKYFAKNYNVTINSETISSELSVSMAETDFSTAEINYLNGDSNCDKKQTIADAVAILQYLGNPDDYPLSELGAFNADSDCNGITADDAVRIQQKDAGIL